MGSLNPKRDFTFIDDTVEAFVKTIKSSRKHGEIINIGSNFEISIKDTVKTISELMGKKINIKTEKKRVRPKTSEVNRLLASNSKAKKLIKWQPKYSGKSGFKKGLLKTIEWFSKPKNVLRNLFPKVLRFLN